MFQRELLSIEGLLTECCRSSKHPPPLLFLLAIFSPGVQLQTVWVMARPPEQWCVFVWVSCWQCVCVGVCVCGCVCVSVYIPLSSRPQPYHLPALLKPGTEVLFCWWKLRPVVTTLWHSLTVPYCKLASAWQHRTISLRTWQTYSWWYAKPLTTMVVPEWKMTTEPEAVWITSSSAQANLQALIRPVVKGNVSVTFVHKPRDPIHGGDRPRYVIPLTRLR